jgi:pimeloyl-ACP methyl ester carboxylesterase
LPIVIASSPTAGAATATAVHEPAARTISDHACDCRALLEHLRVKRAHVIGHSFGDVVALQLALDSPEVIQSLVLLEPALILGDSGPGYRATIEEARRRFRAGDVEPTVDVYERAA